MTGYKSIGQLNYEGLAGARLWLDASGHLMPQWESLTLDEKKYWEAGARRVMQEGWLDHQPARHRR